MTDQQEKQLSPQEVQWHQNYLDELRALSAKYQLDLYATLDFSKNGIKPALTIGPLKK